MHAREGPNATRSASVVSDSSSIRLLRNVLAHDLEEQSLWGHSDSDSASQHSGSLCAGEAEVEAVSERMVTARPSKFLKQLDEYLKNSAKSRNGHQ